MEPLMPSTRLALAAALLLATPLAGQTVGGKGYRATIRTTSYGLPHIKADDLGGAAFGYAYAFAVADLCTLADRWVTLRGERSRFFGVEGPRDGRQAVTNLQSDFYYKWIDASGLVEKELAAPP